MYIKSFGINLDKSKRLWGIIFVALLIAIILIATSFIFVFTSSKKGNINELEDLFNANSYYAEYNVKIVSNKNENNYKIKEWYVKDDNENKFRIETNNEENNFTYFGNQNSIYIKSDQQLSSLNLQEYNSQKNNLLSISTFFDFLHQLKLLTKNDSFIEGNCCKLKEIEVDKELKYIVSFSKDFKECENCKICSEFVNSKMKISKFELILDKEKMMPKQYNIYDINDQMYINIVYNNFSVNSEFDEKLFAI